MSAAWTFILVGLAIVSLPASVLLGAALYLGMWLAGLAVAGLWLAAVGRLWAAVYARVPSSWGTTARLGTAACFGLGVGLSMLAMLAFYSAL